MPRAKAFGSSSRKVREQQYINAAAGRESRWCHDKENIPCSSRHTNSESPTSSFTSKLLTKVTTISRQFASTQRALRRQKQKTVHVSERLEKVREQKREMEHNYQAHTHILECRNKELLRRNTAVVDHFTKLSSEKKISQAKIHALKEKIRRFSKHMARSQEKAKHSLVLRLRQKGVYTAQTRSLVRSLVHAGCAPAKVGKVVREVARVVGARVVGNISARTVQRAQLEGLVAADIQAGYELASAEGITISQDSTSNRHHNYEAHHYATQVPDYLKGETVPGKTSEHKVRLLRVASTLDHTSGSSKCAWMEQLSDIEKTYKDSPLAKRSSAPIFSLRQFALKLKGMHGDHASAEKGTVKLMEAWKQEETLADLGEKQLLEFSDFVSLLAFLNHKKAERIESMGGMDNWNLLSPTERSRHEEKLMHDIKVELGRDVYNTLSDYDRRMLDLFIWAGCCMHKDQNSFKGGNVTMMAYWILNNLVPPILLANKSNAQRIRDILDPSRKDTPLSADEQQVLETTTRGGVKTAALAGALFNNKDDKKGYGDTYQVHLEAFVGRACSRFPDTNNTRFNSHAEAAAHLLLYLSFHIGFLEHVRDAKKHPGWTNIEVNLYNALQDIPTLTELAAMVLYSQSVTHPYMRQVRGPGTEKTNILDLGPLHNNVRAHCEKIIADPLLLTAMDADFRECTLDGQEWEHTEAVGAVKALSPKLPHLAGVVKAFFEGALVTWVRFSSEFAPGGLIDTANGEEKRLAWMPSTNDANEGALGAYRVYMREKPSTTLLQYNAYAVWERNETQSFVDTVFDETDHKYVRKKAREWDAAGKEKERKDQLRVHQENEVALKRKKDAEKLDKAVKRRQYLLQVEIVPLTTVFEQLKVTQLDDQLDALSGLHKDKEIPKKTHRGPKAAKIELLKQALVRYEPHRATPLNVENECSMEIISSWDEEDEMEQEMAEDG